MQFQLRIIAIMFRRKVSIADGQGRGDPGGSRDSRVCDRWCFVFRRGVLMAQRRHHDGRLNRGDALLGGQNGRNCACYDVKPVRPGGASPRAPARHFMRRNNWNEKCFDIKRRSKIRLCKDTCKCSLSSVKYRPYNRDKGVVGAKPAFRPCAH